MTVKAVKLGFVALNTGNYQAMVRHFHDVIGLPIVSESDEATFFGCGSEPHAFALYSNSDNVSGVRHIGFRLERGITLDQAAEELDRLAIPFQQKSNMLPGIDDLIEISDPDGNPLLLYADSHPSEQPYSTKGVGPNKLSHIALFVKDAVKSSDFYAAVLGFKWSDWCEDKFVFMRCNADHHSINLTTGKAAKLWHIAWELRDFSHIGHACDLLARHGRPLLWGPGRHGMGHNLFAYHRDPDGNITEFCTDMDRMGAEGIATWDPRPHHEESAQGPKIWPAGPESSNLWGIMPPPGFME